MVGHVCPECGVHRRRCACVEAEIAAAEDFDPLRVRPYVTLEAPEQGEGPPPTPPPAPIAAPTPADPPEATPTEAVEHAPDVLPYELDGPYEPERPVTRRRGALVALAAAVAVAVVATAALAGDLLGGGDATDDRAAVPTLTASASENIAVSEAPPSLSPSASRSASPSSSPSASASASARTTEATAPAGPQSPSTSRTTTTSAPDPTPTEDALGPTLRVGDSGAEVQELQKRLKQVWAYDGPANGEYTKKVEDAVARYQSYKDIQGDAKGVYGPNTRRALEAETTAEGR